MEREGRGEREGSGGEGVETRLIEGVPPPPPLAETVTEKEGVEREERELELVLEGWTLEEEGVPEAVPTPPPPPSPPPPVEIVAVVEGVEVGGEEEEGARMVVEVGTREAVPSPPPASPALVPETDMV